MRLCDGGIPFLARLKKLMPGLFFQKHFFYFPGKADGGMGLSRHRFFLAESDFPKNTFLVFHEQEPKTRLGRCECSALPKAIDQSHGPEIPALVDLC
jgi:hypothetical protein